MSTYAMPLVVLATTGCAPLTGLAFALEWIPRVAAFGFACTLVDRSGAAIVCFIASLARALLVAGAGVALHLVPPGTAETVTVMALAAVTGALTQFSFIANEAVGAVVSRQTQGQSHKVQSVLIGIDQTAALIGPALGGVLLLTGPTRMLARLSVLSFASAALALQTPPTPLRAARHGGPAPGGGLQEGWQTLRSLPSLKDGSWPAWPAPTSRSACCKRPAPSSWRTASATPRPPPAHSGPSPRPPPWSRSPAAAPASTGSAYGVGVISATIAAAACLAVPQAPSGCVREFPTAIVQRFGRHQDCAVFDAHEK
ncbi:hypothetical protein [Streptomyces sp. NPDC058424]|uniref:hypothetical protein n=1 Tax=Streptomyces sp. NPDC058424 TaxID=3346491 RepID=UPI00365F5AA6